MIRNGSRILAGSPLKSDGATLSEWSREIGLTGVFVILDRLSARWRRFSVDAARRDPLSRRMTHGEESPALELIAVNG